MATWQAVSLDSFRAANELLRGARHRSAVSRAYYAAFSAATGYLESRGVSFTAGRQSPPHRDLADLLGRYYQGSPLMKRQLQTTIRRLYTLRLFADYDVKITVDDTTSRDAVRYSAGVLRGLGAEL
jgi:uncharacterized protein (UPF0332 family)